MTPAVAIAELAQMGLPAERLREAATVIEAVIATALVGEEDRKARDRARKARKSEEQRGKDRNSAEIPGAARKAAETKSAVVDVLLTPSNSEDNTLKQQHRSAKVSRGTRLPDDFQPHPNILELARNLGLTDAEYWDHLERFKDYWRGVSGAKGVKLDWQSTWRNRIKDLADRLRSKSNGKSKGHSIADGFAQINAALDERIRSERGDGDSPEDPRSLPRLRESAA